MEFSFNKAINKSFWDLEYREVYPGGTGQCVVVEGNSMTETERICLEIAWLCSENSESSLVARSEVIGRNVAKTLERHLGLARQSRNLEVM